MRNAARRETAGAPATSWLEDGSVPLHPRSAPEALAALEAVTERLLRDGDPRAAFPDVYAVITRRVAEAVALGEGHLFLEPRWISRLAGRFCERYLETLRWSLDRRAQDTEAWSVAYGRGAARAAPPLQRVLLGLSAHINYDLPIGIARTLAELGPEAEPHRVARFHRDHDAVNHLLRASVPEAFDRLVGRHGCAASRLLYARAYGPAEWMAMELLTSWRSRVWDDAMELLDARTDAPRQRVVRRLEHRSSRIARVLALPGLERIGRVLRAPVEIEAAA
jgi:hypothetical protein